MTREKYMEEKAMSSIDDLFDLDGDGKLNGIEMAFAYSVIFGEDNNTEESSLENLDDLSASGYTDDCGLCNNEDDSDLSGLDEW